MGGFCFAAGTEVLTVDGEVPIEDIRACDWVWSCDPLSGEAELKEVLQTFQRRVDERVVVTVDGEPIETTAGHPFWVVGEGWQEAGDLDIGDRLIGFDGRLLAVENIELVCGLAAVYNFEVEGLHSYYVASNQVLVHNTCDMPDAPKGKLKEMDEKLWKKKGLDFHDVKNANSKFDLYIDDDGHIWRKRKGKGVSDDYAEWIGHESFYVKD